MNIQRTCYQVALREGSDCSGRLKPWLVTLRLLSNSSSVLEVPLMASLLEALLQTPVL